MTNLSPDNVEPLCPICQGRFPEGEGLPDDPPDSATRGMAPVYCSEECQAQGAAQAAPMPLYRITYHYDTLRLDRCGYVAQHASGIFRASGPGHAQVLCRMVVEDLGGRNLDILEVEEVAAADDVTAPEEDPL